MSSYTAWQQMIGRCYDPLNRKYKDYGGRGIKVCDRWICRRLFIEDMGDRPEGKTLNRIDNDGPYSPDNCEWATYQEQAMNRRNNRKLSFNGETKCLSEWSRVVGIRRETLQKRLLYGWTIEQALTTPVSAHNRSLENTHENNYLR